MVSRFSLGVLFRSRAAAFLEGLRSTSGRVRLLARFFLCALYGTDIGQIRGIPPDPVSMLQELCNISNFPMPSQPVRILLVTGSLAAGGAERQWCYLARELASRGYQTVLVVGRIDQEYGHYLPILAGSAVSVRRRESMNVSMKTMCLPAHGIPMTYWCTSLSYIMRHLGSTHVFCQLDGVNMGAGYSGMLTCSGPVKILFSFRSSNPSRLPYAHHPRLAEMYKVLSKSERIVLSGNSRFGNADYAEWIGVESSKIAYIPNAIMPGKMVSRVSRDKMRQSLSIGRDAPVILGLLRCSEEKNPFLFLEVVAGVRKCHPDLVALHAGSRTTAKVRLYAEQLGLGQCVQFLGSRRDVAELMGASDLLLNTSNIEGMPNVVLEAQLLGVPVVATRAGGTEDVVLRNVSAFLADIGDRETLITHCLRVLGDSGLRKKMGIAGRDFVTSEFTVEKLADRTLAAAGLQAVPYRHSGDT